ncbi:hypothetical protein TIFTF001_046729 [Ficus carica]|uniref:Uncharacterized protein n=1 Tax=Ficus carica TaxID=3494 RepID=A0AA88DCN4_FICCA|nr:hypothetical protein TIFTF001_046729 [Ficus carica]
MRNKPGGHEDRWRAAVRIVEEVDHVAGWRWLELVDARGVAMTRHTGSSMSMDSLMLVSSRTR